MQTCKSFLRYKSNTIQSFRSRVVRNNSTILTLEWDLKCWSHYFHRIFNWTRGKIATNRPYLLISGHLIGTIECSVLKRDAEILRRPKKNGNNNVKRLTNQNGVLWRIKRMCPPHIYSIQYVWRNYAEISVKTKSIAAKVQNWIRLAHDLLKSS